MVFVNFMILYFPTFSFPIFYYMIRLEFVLVGHTVIIVFFTWRDFHRGDPNFSTFCVTINVSNSFCFLLGFTHTSIVVLKFYILRYICLDFHIHLFKCYYLYDFGQKVIDCLVYLFVNRLCILNLLWKLVELTIRFWS